MGLKFDTFNKILNHKTWLVPSVHALMGVSISFFHRDLICSNGGKLPSLWSLKTFASPRYIRRPKPPPFPLTKTQLATNSLTCLFSSIKLPFSICSARSCTTLWRGHVCLWHKVSEKGKKTRKRKKEQKIVANLLMILAAMLTMPVSFLSANNFSFFSISETSLLFWSVPSWLQSLYLPSSSWRSSSSCSECLSGCTLKACSNWSFRRRFSSLSRLISFVFGVCNGDAFEDVEE